jgi:hypothetical protein
MVRVIIATGDRTTVRLRRSCRATGQQHQAQRVSLRAERRKSAAHRADATVVREALESAGMLPPEVERMAAGVLSLDGLPRFVWTDEQPDAVSYTMTLFRAVEERQRWRPVREGQGTGRGCGQLFGNRH